jgi:hypothetical protein
MKNMKSLLGVRLTLLLFIAAFVGSATAQRFSIRTADGYLFIQNGQDLSFTCEVKGKKIEPLTTGGNPAFMADGILIQILWVQAKNFEPTGKVESSKLLEVHRDWELDYLKGVFEMTLTPETEKLVIEGRPNLFWSFKRPNHTQEYDRDAFITTLIGRDIFGINSPVKIGSELKTYKGRMLETMTSLKISKTPFDIKKLSEEIRKGSQ